VFKRPVRFKQTYLCIEMYTVIPILQKLFEAFCYIPAIIIS
jgi:hypothetical protein